MPPRPELLIDAYNVMFAHPEIGRTARRDLEAARDAFIAYVRQNRPNVSSAVYIVFDAHREPRLATNNAKRSAAGGVHLVYAVETADVWIQERIRRHSDPKSLTIVTSDREILQTVHAFGAAVLRVREFLHLQSRKRSSGLRRRQEKPEHLSKKKIQEWEKIFRDKRDEEEPPA